MLLHFPWLQSTLISSVLGMAGMDQEVPLTAEVTARAQITNCWRHSAWPSSSAPTRSTRCAGVTHLTHKREAAVCLLIDTSDLTKFDSKRNSGLTRLNGKVHLIAYCIEGRVRQNHQGDPPAKPGGSESSLWCSKFLRRGFRCSWIQT